MQSKMAKATPEPPQWVLDTNVVVSAALTAGGTCDRIMRAAIDNQIRLAWSSPILAEYRAVLSRPRFGLASGMVAALLAAFGPRDRVTPTKVPSLPDRDDEVFLATALATPDQILVTGNAAHFPCDRCRPVTVLTPAEALRRLRSR